MSATLKLTREEGFGFELRRGEFLITLDGHEAGSIEDHSSVDLSLQSGEHILELRRGRYSSKPRSFTVADGDVIGFRCHGAKLWPIYVASLVKPDLAIALDRV